MPRTVGADGRVSEAPAAHDALRVAIAGFGRIATEAHLPAYRSRERFRVVAVADPADARRELAAGEIPRASRFGAVARMVESDFDLLDVCSPPVFHAEQILLGLRAGKHVLCEKPLALTHQQFTELIQCAESAQRLLYPCHNWHFAPAIAHAQQVILTGAIGEPKSARIAIERRGSARGADGWRPDWRQDIRTAGGGIWTDHGPHVIYLAETLLAAPITAVALRTEHAGRVVEQTATADLTLVDRAAQIRLSWLAGGRRTTYAITGTEGELLIDEGRLRLRGRTRLDEPLVRDAALDDGIRADWYRGVLDDLSAALASGRLLTPALMEAERIARAIENGYESAAIGGVTLVVGDQTAALKLSQPLSTAQEAS